MPSATLTIPVARWNKLERDIAEIKAALSIGEQTEWVPVGVLIAKGISRDTVRYHRNDTNSRKNGSRWLYDKKAFEQYKKPVQIDSYYRVPHQQ